jgi:hypothetical protein
LALKKEQGEEWDASAADAADRPGFDPGLFILRGLCELGVKSAHAAAH